MKLRHFLPTHSPALAAGIAQPGCCLLVSQEVVCREQKRFTVQTQEITWMISLLCQLSIKADASQFLLHVDIAPLTPHRRTKEQNHQHRDFQAVVIGHYCLVTDMAMVEFYDRLSITPHSKTTCCFSHWVYLVLTQGGPSNRKALLQIVVAVWSPIYVSPLKRIPSACWDVWICPWACWDVWICPLGQT